MLKKLALTIVPLAVSATLCAAQARPAQTSTPSKPAADVTKAEPTPAQKAPPEPAPLPLNIRIDVSITDQTGNGTPARKVVSVIAGDRQSTNIRSSAIVAVKIGGGTNNRNVTINVDARPVILQKDPTKINVTLGLEYLPKPANAQEEIEGGMTSFSERLGLILESGKPMIISQAADPTSDRKITVEVTATILK